MATPKTLTLTDDRTKKAYELYGKAKVDNAIAKQAGVGQVVKAPSIGTPLRIEKNADGTTTTNTGGTSTTGTTWAVAGSAGSIVGEADDPYFAQYGEWLLNDANMVINEDEIKANKLKEYQAQLDALQTVQNDELNKYRIQAQQRSWQASIIQGARWLAGSNVGTAMDNTVTQSNNEIEAALLAQQALARQAIYGEVRKGAQDEINAKLEAKKAGWQAYLTYIKWETERKSARSKEIARRLIASKADPSQLTDADWKDLEAKGYSKQDILMEYQDMKAAQDSAAAAAEAAATTTNLNNQKTQAEINKINSDASRNYEEGGYVYNSKGELIAQVVGKNYEAGGRIYESGTNKYIGDARSVANSSPSSPSSSSNTNNAGNIVTTQLSNGQSITIGQNAANALQNVTNTIPWIKFDTQNSFRTADDQAKLYGKGRTAAQLQAAWVNPAYAQPNVPQVTWTLQSNHMSGNAVDVVGDKNYLDSIEAQMNAAGFVRPAETMARGDYGHFEYQGWTAWLSDLAQSVQKGIITIAQIPAAQRSAVAAELSQAGQSSPKSVELQNSLSLVDTMLQDEEALKSISGWWGWRLPLTGLFSNQLAANQFDQLKGILSLWEREKLKGSGAISDFESKMLAQAASALGRNLSEEDFKAELEKIRDILSGKYKYYTEWGTNTGIAPTGNTGTGWVVNWAI